MAISDSRPWLHPVYVNPFQAKLGCRNLGHTLLQALAPSAPIHQRAPQPQHRRRVLQHHRLSRHRTRHHEIVATGPIVPLLYASTHRTCVLARVPGRAGPSRTCTSGPGSQSSSPGPQPPTPPVAPPESLPPRPDRRSPVPSSPPRAPAPPMSRLYAHPPPAAGCAQPSAPAPLALAPPAGPRAARTGARAGHTARPAHASVKAH